MKRSTNLNCNTCTISECYIAKHCSSEWKKYVNDHKLLINYKKRQHVFYQGDAVFGIYFIGSGSVKIFKKGEEGKSQIIRLAKTGDILGHRGHGGNSIYPISAVTIENSSICFLENLHYYKVLKYNHEMVYNLMLFYAEELMRSESRMQQLVHAKSKERVAEALLMIKNVLGKEIDDKIFIGAKLTRREIGEIAGLSPEQVSRTLTEFKREQLIETDRKAIIIPDLVKFENMVPGYEAG